MPDNYRRLFDVNTYNSEEQVHFYKGWGGAEAGPPVLIPESIFMRIKHLGQAYKLHCIPMFDLYGDVVFNKIQVMALMDEIRFILSFIDDKVLEHFLAPLIPVPEEITRSQAEHYLIVMGVLPFGNAQS